MESKIILGRILQRFIDQGYAQVDGYNRFGFIEFKNQEVWVTREKGKNTKVPFAKILDGIEAYRNNFDRLIYISSIGLKHFLDEQPE
jgi:hypothetical protein